MGSMTDAPRTCADCPADIIRTSANGPWPKRCPSCSHKYRRAMDRTRDRRRYATDPGYRERKRKASKSRVDSGLASVRQKERYRLDAAYRERTKAAASRWQAENPGYVRRKNRENRPTARAQAKARYQSDPGYRAKIIAYVQRRYVRLGGEKPRRWLPDAVARQGGICTWCSLPLPDDLSAIHADHIYPASRGGETSPENTAALHAACNMAKGARVAA